MSLLSRLLGEKCPVCGMKIKDTFTERTGKKFCSKECADKWEKEETEKKKALEKEEAEKKKALEKDLPPCCRK